MGKTRFGMASLIVATLVGAAAAKDQWVLPLAALAILLAAVWALLECENQVARRNNWRVTLASFLLIGAGVGLFAGGLLYLAWPRAEKQVASGASDGPVQTALPSSREQPKGQAEKPIADPGKSSSRSIEPPPQSPPAGPAASATEGKYPADELPRRRTELADLRVCITDKVEAAWSVAQELNNGVQTDGTGIWALERESPRKFIPKLEALDRQFKTAIASCQTVLNRYGHEDIAAMVNPVPSMERPINQFVNFLYSLDDKPVTDIRRQVFSQLARDGFTDAIEKTKAWIAESRRRIDQKAAEYAAIR